MRADNEDDYHINNEIPSGSYAKTHIQMMGVFAALQGGFAFFRNLHMQELIRCQGLEESGQYDRTLIRNMFPMNPYCAPGGPYEGYFWQCYRSSRLDFYTEKRPIGGIT